MPISSFEELVTTSEARRKGFLAIALRKSREAIPYVDRARIIQALCRDVSNPIPLLASAELHLPLCEAAGLSTKALNVLSAADVDSVISEFVNAVLVPAGDDFIDEFVYRFLLSKGDALGGKMRNIAGAVAQEKLSRFVIAFLATSGFRHQVLLRDATSWTAGDLVNGDLISSVVGIKWHNRAEEEREISYNRTVPIVGKNVDICLFRKFSPLPVASGHRRLKVFVEDLSSYLACGELKGGIDPAGADEHWKTANTSLSRIRSGFRGRRPPVHTFFVGAAIERSMAQEIFQQVATAELGFAANLTVDDQLSDLCRWMLGL